jgi:hypothetical protein
MHDQSIKLANVCERTPLVLGHERFSRQRQYCNGRKVAVQKEIEAETIMESPGVSTCLDMRKEKPIRS